MSVTGGKVDNRSAEKGGNSAIVHEKPNKTPLSVSHASQAELSGSVPSTSNLLILFLTSFSLLSYEIFLTRIISALFLKYFSVLAISMAMAGLGIAGVLVQVLADRGKWISHSARLWLIGCGLVGSLILVPVYVVFVRVPNYLLTTFDLVWLLMFVSICILPFFFGGLILSDAYHRFPHQVNRVYSADLVGAAGGALAAFLLLRYVGAFTSILFSAIIGALVMLSISLSYYRIRRLPAAAVLAAAICFFLLQGFFPVLKFPHPSRRSGVNRFEKWSEMGLTTVARFSRFAGDGISEKAGLMDPHVFKFISHDYNSSTMAVDPILAQRETSKILSQIGSFPFQFIPAPHVLVLGAGGGKEVYTALAAGARKVTAVEFNRVIVEDIMLGELLDFSGGLYQKEAVEVVVDEARNYLNRDRRKYDVIIPVMGSTPGLVAAGCYLFSTEYLQTAEAYRSYLDHLSDRGVFSFICFFKKEEFNNSLGTPYRILATVKEILKERGLDPARHMMVVGGTVASADTLYSHALNVVFSPSPFSREDGIRAENIARKMGFDLLYSAYQKKDLLVSRFIEARYLEPFYEASTNDIRPVTDDRPFYYDYRKKGADGYEGEEPEYFHMIHSISYIFAFYVLAILVIPLWSAGVRGERVPPLRRRSVGGTIRGLGYFLCLGAGFVTVQLTLMQKAQFLLGIPSYGFFAAVFSFTLFMGAGSRVSGKFNPSRGIIILIVGLLSFFSLGLFSLWGSLVNETSGWSIGSKVALVVACFAPVGFVCGFPFALGIRKFAGEKASAWMWAINAATATMGSVLVTLLWMEWGFFQTLLMGLGCYVMAVFLL